MNDDELKAWVHRRIVLTFEEDTLKIHRRTIVGIEIVIVQIFRNKAGEGEKPIMEEVGGFQFDVGLLEHEPGLLERRLFEESRLLAYKMHGFSPPEGWPITYDEALEISRKPTLKSRPIDT